MSEPLNAFEAALTVRDAIVGCACCDDPAESQERYDAAHALLEWVVQSQAEIAGLRALTSGVVSPRTPLTAAERSKAYRARKSVTKTVTNRHENRHAAVTPAVTVDPPSQTLPPEENKQANERKDSEKEDGDRSLARSENAREAVTAIVTDSVTARDAARAWQAALQKPGAAPVGTAHAHKQWREDFETIAGVVNAAIEPPHRHNALRLLCEWFWLGDDGPVQAKRMNRAFTNPGHLAARPREDLDRALAWHDRTEAAQ